MIKDPGTGEALHVLDVHHHLALGEGTSRADLLERRLAIMDRGGIDAACLMPPSGAFGTRPRMEELNNATAEVCASEPKRFPAGLIHVDLAMTEPLVLAELARATKELDLRGAVFHHRFQGVFLDHPLMVPVMRWCADAGIPVFIHVVGESTLEAAWRLDALLEKAAGDGPVVALDAFSSSDRAFEVLRMMARRPNLYVDLGAMNAAVGYALDAYIAEVGSERIVLGTDLYVEPVNYHFPFAIHEVANLDIDVAAKRRILGQTVAQLLGLTPEEWPPS